MMFHIPLRHLFITMLVFATVSCTLTPQPPLATIMPTEQVVAGQSGPKQGEATPVPGLPTKGGSTVIEPINPAGGEKALADEVTVPEPGSRYLQGDQSAKAPPDAVQAPLGQGAKESGVREPEKRRYGRATFRMTAEGTTPVSLEILEGELLPSQTINGDMLYVFTLDGEPVFTGTFRDPLVAVGLPQEPEQGYSATPMEEGFFSVSIPEDLLVRDALALSSVTIYRLDPTLPYTFTLNSDTVGTLFERSAPVAQVDGQSLVELLEQQQ